MEWIITDGIIGIIVILTIYLVILAILEIKLSKKVKEDNNIEWYGPNVTLKKKEYPEINDDFRETINEVEVKDDNKK